MKNKKGQVTIFIIIAVILIALVGVFFAVRNVVTEEKIPAEIESVYNSFLACVEENTLTGVSVLESQGGYIELPAFEPGSSYMPFSSQLDFLGNPIPYWYYVSGNNIQKEQVPTEVDMEIQLAKFVEDKVRDCNFDSFYEEGYLISKGIPEASTNIKDNSIDVQVDMSLTIELQGESYVVNDHDVSVDSYLGKLYTNARRIYQREQNELFLERYAVDNLRLYAPVDGVELSCSPKIWSADQVFNELQQAIQDNTLTLNSNDEEYYNVNLNEDSGVEVKFINSVDWPNSFEVNPAQGSLLIADPIGIQPGLGVLGFCYVPYHFVYNVRYPVLIQVSEGLEIFQFPVAVVLQGNNAREAFAGTASGFEDFGICDNKNTPIQVNAYDSDLNPINAQISYECFGEICDIGTSPLTNDFPQCVNGYILARADGYADAEFLFSTTSAGSAQIIMEKIYPIEVKVNINGIESNERTIIYFNSEEESKVVSYPEQKTVDLISNNYDIEVYVYKDSSLTFEATTLEQCTDIPMSGIAGALGLKEEKCIEVEMPEQLITHVLVGGGKASYPVSESELESSRFIEINLDSLTIPENVDQMYSNQLAIEDKEIEIMFR